MQASALSDTGTTQQALLRELLRHKQGLTIDALAEKYGISRNGIRQHLLALERDGLVTRGEALPSGGRPEHVYVLTKAGIEKFPRQYAWMSELLLQAMREDAGDEKMEQRLEAMGGNIGASFRPRLRGIPGSPSQLAALAEAMVDLGYDAETATEEGQTIVRAHNCVFHQLAQQHPQVCKFDTALLSAATGCSVEQSACMRNGDNACCFKFSAKK